MPNIELYEEAFSIENTTQLLGLVLSSVQGDFGYEVTTSFEGVNGLVDLQEYLVSDPNNFYVHLLENQYVHSSVGGLVDLYSSNIAPTLINLANKVTVYLRAGSSYADITKNIISLSVSYSLDKYVGEMTAVIKDEFFYDQFVPMNFFGQCIFIVMVDNTNVGEFLFETRSASAQFGVTQISVWGRTKPALLSPPYGKLLTKTWQDQTSAKQIALEVMAPYPGVNLIWNIMDYPILGGKISADRRSPVEMLATLAEPVGGIVTTNFNGDLIVDYKWKGTAS